MAEEHKETKERWLNYLALSSVILAVCATLSSFRGSSYSTRTVLSQTQSSDQWAYYQAKSVKANLYELQKQELEMEISLLPSKGSEKLRDLYDQRIKDYTKRVVRYNEEMNQIEQQARNFEFIRDHALAHGQSFGIAVIFLQVAILLSSIAALLKMKLVWLLGLFTGAAGMLFFINGFWAFF
jgi:hypothetical protein